MEFYSTEMINTSTREDKVNNITINLKDALSTKQVGVARMTSFNNIYLETKGRTGYYALKDKAVKELKKHNITNLDELMSKSWLVSEGDWILHQLTKQSVA